MKSFLQLFFGIAFVVISCKGSEEFEYFKEKPPFLPSCEIYKPNFAQCSRYAAQKFYNAIVLGIPELFYDIGSLEPIYLERLPVRVNNYLGNIKGNFSDVHIRGFSNLTFIKSDVSKNDFTWSAKMYVPLLRFEYTCDIDGVVLGKPVKKLSDTIIELEKVDMTMTVNARLFEKDDITFYGVNEVHLTIKPKRVKSNISNFLNPETYKAYKGPDAPFDVNPAAFDLVFSPYITKTLERLFLGVLQIAFNAIPSKYFISDLPTSTQVYGKPKPNIQPSWVF